MPTVKDMQYAEPMPMEQAARQFDQATETATFRPLPITQNGRTAFYLVHADLFDAMAVRTETAMDPRDLSDEDKASFFELLRSLENADKGL